MQFFQIILICNAFVTPYGGVYVNDSTAYFNNVEFADNIFRGYDRSYGVALYVRSSDVTLENCTFKHNGYRHTANNIWTPQSVISIDEGTLSLDNCLFENNGTENVIAGPDMISVFGGTVKINKSIFRNNSSERAIFLIVDMKKKLVPAAVGDDSETEDEE